MDYIVSGTLGWVLIMLRTMLSISQNTFILTDIIAFPDLQLKLVEYFSNL